MHSWREDQQHGRGIQLDVYAGAKGRLVVQVARRDGSIAQDSTESTWIQDPGDETSDLCSASTTDVTLGDRR